MPPSSPSIHMRRWPPTLMMMRDIEKIYKHTNFNLNGTVIIKKEANVDDNIQVGWLRGSFHIFIDLNKRHKISFRLVLCLPVWMGGGFSELKVEPHHRLNVSFELCF